MTKKTFNKEIVWRVKKEINLTHENLTLLGYGYKRATTKEEKAYYEEKIHGLVHKVAILQIKLDQYIR